MIKISNNKIKINGEINSVVLEFSNICKALKNVLSESIISNILYDSCSGNGELSTDTINKIKNFIERKINND